MHYSSKVRKPAVAGQFYSRQKETLEREVAVFLENSPQIEIVKRIYGLVAPHAGYLYSGGVAARAFRQIIDQEFEVVVVISPSHRIYFEEISVYDGAAYSTPLGEIKVDQDLAQKLSDSYPGIVRSDLGHDVDEHALEVQLPFLQHVLGEFTLLPVVMGNQDEHNVQLLAQALVDTLRDKSALIIASSDLSHFYSYDRATVLDKVVVEHINQFDADSLASDLNSGACEMCGGGPVMATMKACKMLGATKSKVLLYRNSGDVTGDRNQVVGYLAAIFYD
jgi:AmmeMemoRadiSam system protein B